MVDGDPEVGKSFLSLAIATAVTLGTALPEGQAGRPGGVLILTAEDGLGDTVRPRAEELGADLTKLFCLTAIATSDGKTKHFSLAEDLETLEDYLRTCPISLIIIDPINAYLGASIDTNRDAALRSVLTPLAELAERFVVAVLVIRHLTKGTREKAIYRGQGSIAYVATARSVLLLGKNPQDESERVVVCIKNNLAAHPSAVSFELKEGEFHWKGLSTLTADDILRPESGERVSAVDEASTFLREALAEGSRPGTEVEKEAKLQGISGPALQRARRNLAVVSKRIGEAGKQGGGAWLWSLPANSPLDLDDQGDRVENLISLTRSESEDARAPEDVDHLNHEADAVLSNRSPAVRAALEMGAEPILPREEQEVGVRQPELSGPMS